MITSGREVNVVGGRDHWSPSERNAARYYARLARVAVAEARRRQEEQTAAPLEPPPVRRVLVTGSRDWTDWRTIGEALTWARPTVVVHGSCYPQIDPATGRRPWVSADYLAHLWCGRHGIPDEPHPANWEALGARAGLLRNAAMVNLGADLCLAFVSPCTRRDCRLPQPHTSHGTAHCIALAEKAGIPVRRFEQRYRESGRIAL